MINPSYQRDYVWTAADQERYLDTIFNNREGGRFVLVKNKYPARTEILDGQQRLTTLALFIGGHISYKGAQYSQLSCQDIVYLDNYTIQVTELNGVDYTPAELLAVFLEVNEAGVPQSEEHLAKVRERYQALVQAQTSEGT